MKNLEQDRIKALETALKECTDYIVEAICEATFSREAAEHLRVLNEVEDLLGIPQTPRSAFY